MTIPNVIILAMAIIYLLLLCITYWKLRRIGRALDGLVWTTQKLLDDLRVQVDDGDHTRENQPIDAKERRQNAGQNYRCLLRMQKTQTQRLYMGDD